MERLILLFMFRNTITGAENHELIFLNKNEKPSTWETYSRKAYAIGESLAIFKGYDDFLVYYCGTEKIPVDYKSLFNKCKENCFIGSTPF